MTSDDAINLMLTRLRTAWDGDAGAIAGYVPAVMWPEQTQATAPDASKYFLRVQTQIENTVQQTLGRPARWLTSGKLYGLVYGPRSDHKAAANARSLAELVSNAFRGVSEPGGMWYRNTMAGEYRPEANWLVYRAVIAFEFDEMR